MESVGQTMKTAIIFDMDGTIALIDHRLHHIQKEPKDWDSFYDAMVDDRPNEMVINTFNSLIIHGRYSGLICTGRPEDYRAVTEGWLEQQDARYQGIYMRSSGDHRPDVIVKRELLTQMRNDGYIPVLACEDRDSVVAMWRKEGLVCLQAAPGDF